VRLKAPAAFSRRMPREPLDALENLPKEASRQVAFGELRGEVPGMPDEASARLEQPLLETRQGPALDGDGQAESTQQIAEVVVGDDAQDQADLVSPEPMKSAALCGGWLFPCPRSSRTHASKPDSARWRASREQI
jgi:hypothetical protein